MNKKLIKKAEKHLWTLHEESGRKNHWLDHHIPEVERWAKKLLERYPDADTDVLLLSVFLHDIGQITEGLKTDHAGSSEREARRFLAENDVDEDIIDKVAHCVRAHRNNDVKPKTLEEKILVIADSMSHLTDFVYIKIMKDLGKKETLEKLERDYRDSKILPGIEEEIRPLYFTWKKLIEEMPDL